MVTLASTDGCGNRAATPLLGGRFFDNATGLTPGRNRPAPWSRARELLGVCGVWDGSARQRFGPRCGKPQTESAHRLAHTGKRIRPRKAWVQLVRRWASRAGQARAGSARTALIRPSLRAG